MPISYFRAILIGIGLALLFAFQNYLRLLYWGETHYFNWEKNLMVPLVNFTLWALLLPLVYYFVTKYKGSGFFFYRKVSSHNGQFVDGADP